MSYSILQLPQALNDAWLGGSNLLAAQLICSSIPIFITFILLGFSKSDVIGYLVFGVMILGLCTVLGWLPIPVFIFIVLLMAVWLAQTWADVLGSLGRRK